ncbi:uncharacterized protein LOC128944810 [Melozone crissalis]|uniref:uncharacterized protein LOC128944810 n=1 Tax=Melozone crissalis TaxID=40204 RepID=UPI0023DC2C58|nr:uncharacterized protein LOC128944810 [Melozone crissalis]
MLSHICLTWVLLVLLTGSTVSESIVIGEVGQDISVPCRYSVWNRDSITSMCWGRGSCPKSKCSRPIIWTDGWRVTEQHSSRYQLRGDLHRGDVSLTIVDARESDSGTYCCRVEIPGWFNDQLINHKVVVRKARISTASPHTYTSEQTSGPGSTRESSFTVTRTWPPVSASEAPQTASTPCSGPSDCLDVAASLQNASVSLPREQHPEHGLYIGIGSCAAVLLILILALLLSKQYFYNIKKMGGSAGLVAFQRPRGMGSHSALEEENPAEENVYIMDCSGKDKIWFPTLPLTTWVSPSARMSHFVLFYWMVIQIFIAPTVCDMVVRGTEGQPVTLPCSYRVAQRKDISDMCWGRGRCPNSKCSNKILHTSGPTVTFRVSQRYSLRGSVPSGDVSLTIGAAQAQDAGLYCCRVEIPGLFNDIKRNIRLLVARAPPVTTTTTTSTTTTSTTSTSTTSTTTEAPVFSIYFTETTSAPQATSDPQPTTETTVLLTTSPLPPATTAPQSPAVTTGDTSAPPTIAVGTENDIFTETVMETSSSPDFPTTFQAADVTTEDDMFCSTLPGSTEVTTELPDKLPAAEETSTSVLMEELSVRELSANSDGSAGKYEDREDEAKLPFPSSAIVIACVVAGSILLGLLVWKRKQTKKFIVKSAGPPEETDKAFSGAEGENNIFSL